MHITYCIRTGSFSFYFFFFISVQIFHSFFSMTTFPFQIKFSLYLCPIDFYIISPFHPDQSTVTSSRRHFVFLDWKSIINDIFNTEFQKSTKLGTYHLHVILYQMTSRDFGRASWRAHVRAPKFQNAPIDLEIVLDTFQTILSISKISARTRPCARFLRTQHVRKPKFPFLACFGFLTL